MRRRASAASRAFCGAGHSIRLVGHHRQQVVGGILRLAGCLKNGALVVAERGQPVLDIRGMVFAFLDLETDNRADEGCAQLGHEFVPRIVRSEEHTSELQSLMRISYAVFCLKKKTNKQTKRNTYTISQPTYINYNKPI